MAVKSFRESLKDCFVGDTLIYSVIKAATAFLVCFFLFFCLMYSGSEWRVRKNTDRQNLADTGEKALLGRQPAELQG